jgi:bifunctional DNA-binding transcriptional regulator/antitoxin component of YhaV-PrlF toxin-antitoxin module
MTTIETVQVGKGGDVPIPVGLRKIAGIDAGTVVTIEAREGALLIRPASDVGEHYTPERKAEFLLSNAVDVDDYRAAREEVRRLGIDPDQVPHHKNCVAR